ncbi:hypothetical protein UNSW1_1808 [Campylobacter concisus UNSW1]|nr:hypothetical protein UNSW1_1808 [Campylobacter concisus UNSW1]
MIVGVLSFVKPPLTLWLNLPPSTSSITSVITGASGALVASLFSPITPLPLPGLSGLLGLTISAIIVLSLPGFRSTGTSMLPLSISFCSIGLTVSLPLSSVTISLSPGFTLPSFGIEISAVVLPASLSPALFSLSEILPSFGSLSSGNVIDGLLGWRVSSESSVSVAFDESLMLPASSANLYSGVSYLPFLSFSISTLNVASNLPSLIISSVIVTNLTQLPLLSIDWITSPAFMLPSVGISITQ